MVTSISIDRTALSLEPLVITPDWNDDFHVTEDGIGRPNFELNRTYAPESEVLEGQQLLAVRRRVGGLPLQIYAHGSTTAEVEANKDALDAAFSQFAYQITQTIDGVARTYWADPELPTWGPVDSGEVAAYIAIATITVPLQPGLVT